jgi:hypothetical protein
MTKLRVLIATYDLSLRGGTQMYVRDLALGLLRRGHTPIVYSTQLGDVADEIRSETIAVTDNLDAVATTPDVIHGNHSLETLTALLQFPQVPAIQTVHGNMGFLSAAPKFTRILRYIPVDYTCYERIIFEHGIPEERVRVILNSVDLERFRARKDLPVRPQKALVFSNYTDNGNYLKVVREACRRTGLPLDVLGGEANVSAKPEQTLGDYDLVCAKARCALESLAVGSAVVLCDHHGLGPMVTTTALEDLRRLNFGHRTLKNKLTADLVANEISKYDAADAKAVSQKIRATSDVNNMVEEIIAQYWEVLAVFRESPAPDFTIERREAAAYLRWLSGQIHSNISARAALKLVLSRIPILNSPQITRQLMNLAWKLTSAKSNEKR